MKKSDFKNLLIALVIVSFITLIVFLLNHENENKNNRTNYLHNYDINEIQYVYVDEQEMAQKYLADLVKKVYYFPEDIYDILEVNYKSNYKTFEDFKKYLDKYIKSYLFENAKVVSYASGIYNNYNCFYVNDEAGNNFIFIEKSIMDYELVIK